MTSILLFLSFLLHLVTLAVIVLLFKQIQSLKQSDSAQDMMALMDTYLEDIKQENRLLEQSVSTKQPPDETFQNLQTEKEEMPAGQSDNAGEPHYMPQTDHVADDSKLSLEAQVLQLYHQGMTSDDIARHLNCGKTEAELIIKLKGKTS